MNHCIMQIFVRSEQLKHISFTVPNQHTLTDLEVESIEKILR